MKKITRLYFLVFFVNISFSQTKLVIDSINNIPFETRQEKASILDDDYLLNAKNAKEINYKLGEAESYSNLSLIYYYQGKYEKDVHYSLQSIKI